MNNTIGSDSDSYRYYEELASQSPNGYKITQDLFGGKIKKIMETAKLNTESDRQNLQNAISGAFEESMQYTFMSFMANEAEIFKLFKEIKDDFTDLKDNLAQPGIKNQLVKTSRNAERIYRRLEDIDKDLELFVSKELVTLPEGFKSKNYFSEQYTDLPKGTGINPTYLNKASGKVEELFDTQLYNPDRHKTIRVRLPADKWNLDNETQTPLEEYEYMNEKDKEVDSEDVQARLNNCFVLEHLYLRKHEELFNVFSFTVNLFDKYRLSTNILVFLIKYLIQQGVDVGLPGISKPDIPPKISVRIPKKIIKNIRALISDQDAIQKIIKDMRDKTNKDQLEQKYSKLVRPHVTGEAVPQYPIKNENRIAPPLPVRSHNTHLTRNRSVSSNVTRSKTLPVGNRVGNIIENKLPSNNLVVRRKPRNLLTP